MKRKNLAALIICLSILFSLQPASTVYAMEVSHSTETATESIQSSITPRAHYIDWRYKSVNGKIYRRLYDYTDDCWIGDWELCP